MGIDIQGWANVFRTPFFIIGGWALIERHGMSFLWERVVARVDFVREEFLKRELHWCILKRNQEHNREKEKRLDERERIVN